MLQIVLANGDQRLFSPARDPALHGEWALKEIASRIQSGDNPMLESLITVCNIRREDIGDAMVALANAYCSSLFSPKLSFYEALTETGFLKLALPVQALLMAAFGQIEFSIAWHGMREATSGGHWPGLDAEGLTRLSAEASARAYEKALEK